jgi:MFS family permease
MLSWSVPCILWAFAQNFWWFMAAAAFNAMFQISNISFGLLLAEDTGKQKLVNVYSWIQITGLLATFFAPISSYIVGKFDLVVLMRALYLIFFLTLTVKIFHPFPVGQGDPTGGYPHAGDKERPCFVPYERLLGLKMIK